MICNETGLNLGKKMFIFVFPPIKLIETFSTNSNEDIHWKSKSSVSAIQSRGKTISSGTDVRSKYCGTLIVSNRRGPPLTNTHNNKQGYFVQLVMM